jgi:hypothetical protein
MNANELLLKMDVRCKQRLCSEETHVPVQKLLHFLQNRNDGVSHSRETSSGQRIRISGVNASDMNMLKANKSGRTTERRERSYTTVSE